MELQINNKLYRLAFGYGAIEKCCDYLNCDLSELPDKFSDPDLKVKIDALRALIISAIENYTEESGELQKISKSDINKDIDFKGLVTLNKVLEGFNKSMFLGRQLEEYANDTIDPNKKKVTKKKA